MRPSAHPILRHPVSENPHQYIDQRVILHDISWAHFEQLLKAKGDAPIPRVAYLDGELELMTPSWYHEAVKKQIARLLEAWADETGVELTGVGSWTLRRARRRSGLEPDECYVVGSTKKEKPDLAIEVVWTSGGLTKLDIYRALGVREVWRWRKGKLEVYILRRGAYSRSARFPKLDLELFMRFVEYSSQTRAVREYRQALRRQRRTKLS